MRHPEATHPTDTAAEFLLIRHAHTDAAGRLCGSLDLPLSHLGRRQVRALGDRAPRHPAPDALYSSPLRRAREVAEVLGERWGLAPHVVESAREIDCGAFEGMPLSDLARMHPDLWARNAAQDDEAFSWPDGENYGQFRRRVMEGFAALARQHPGARVAVVTHAGVVSQVLGVLRGRSAAAWDPDRPDPFTCTAVTWVNGAPGRLLCFSERDWF